MEQIQPQYQNRSKEINENLFNPSKKYFSKHIHIVPGEEFIKLQNNKLRRNQSLKEYKSLEPNLPNYLKDQNKITRLPGKNHNLINKKPLLRSISDKKIQFETRSQSQNKNNRIPKFFVPNQGNQYQLNNNFSINLNNSQMKGLNNSIKQEKTLKLSTQKLKSLASRQRQSFKKQQSFLRRQKLSITNKSQISEQKTNNKSLRLKSTDKREILTLIKNDSDKQRVLDLDNKKLNDPKQRPYLMPKIRKQLKLQKVTPFKGPQQGFIQIQQQTKSLFPEYKNVFQICSYFGAKRITISSAGVTLFFNKLKYIQQITNQEFISFKRLEQLSNLHRKLRKNNFFDQFNLIKSFNKWKKLINNFYFNYNKRQIEKISDVYDRNYYKSLIRYKQIIMNFYGQFHTNQQILVIKNLYMNKLKVQNYLEGAKAIFKKNVFKFQQNQRMKQIIQMFLNNLRIWIHQYQAKKIQASQSYINNGSSSLVERYQKSRVQRQQQKNKYQSYQIRTKMQKQKRLLKKIFYMIEQQKYNFFYKILNQIKTKIQNNYHNFLNLWNIHKFQNKKHSLLKNNKIKSIKNLDSQKEIQRKIILQAKIDEKSENKQIKIVKHNHKETKVKFEQRILHQNQHREYFDQSIKQPQDNSLLKQIGKIKAFFQTIFTHDIEFTRSIVFQSIKNLNQIQKKIKSQINNNKNYILKIQSHQFRFIPFHLILRLQEFKNYIHNKIIQNRQHKNPIMSQNYSLLKNRLQLKQSIEVTQIEKIDQKKKYFNSLKNFQQNNKEQKQQAFIQQDKSIKKEKDDQKNQIQNIKQIAKKLIDYVIQECSNGNQNKYIDFRKTLEINQNAEKSYQLRQQDYESKGILKYYCQLQFVNQKAFSGEYSGKQFHLINQVLNSINNYNFDTFMKSNNHHIQEQKQKIFLILTQNYKQVVQVKKKLIEVLSEICLKIQQFYKSLQVSQFYQMINKFLVTLTHIPQQIRVGNFILSIQQIMKYVTQISQNKKNELINQTPIKTNELYNKIHLILTNFNQQISLSCWNFNQFVKSYKKSIQFKRQSCIIQNQLLQEFQNYLILINITMPNKTYESYYLLYLEVKDLFQKVCVKKIKFQQSISKKLKFIQPQKQQLIRKIQKQLDYIIKKLFSFTQKTKLIVQKCYDQISQLLKQLYEWEEVIMDLQLVRNLEIIHCIKSQQQTHFHSFGKTKNQISFILKLLSNYKQFQLILKQQMNINFREFRTEYFLQLVQKQRIKIKHGNRVLYQFQTFITNCYSLYDDHKSIIQLIQMIKKLQIDQLETIGGNKELFDFNEQPIYTGDDILALNITQNQQFQIENIIKKNQFTQHFINTLVEIQKQVSRLKFQVRKQPELNQNIISNIDQNMNIMMNYSTKLSSMKDTKSISQINNQSYVIVKKIQQIYNFMTFLSECQLKYIQLNRFKKRCLFDQNSNFYNKICHNQNQFLATIQQNKTLWSNLLLLLDGFYLDHIINYQIQKINKVLISLQASIQKQFSLFQSFIHKKKEEFPLLYLFQIDVVMSIIASKQIFFTYFYHFIKKATFQILNQHLVFKIQTIYGEVVIVELNKINQQIFSKIKKRTLIPINRFQNKKEEPFLKLKLTNIQQRGLEIDSEIQKVDPQKRKQKQMEGKQFQQPQETKLKQDQKINEIIENLSNEHNLNKLNKAIKKSIQQTFLQMYSNFQTQKNIKLLINHDTKILIAIVYIIDQIKLLKSLKNCIENDKKIFYQAFHQNLSKQIIQLTAEYKQFNKDLCVYEKNLTTILLMSKIQFRDKLSYLSQNNQNNQIAVDKFYCMMQNFFQYYCKDVKSQIFLSCYNYLQPLYYQLVDSMSITVIEPVTQKVYISLFKTVQRQKYGVLQKSTNLLNLSSRMLRSVYYIQSETFQSPSEILDIAFKQQIIFVIKSDNKMTDQTFLKTCSSMFMQVNALKVQRENQIKSKTMNNFQQSKKVVQVNQSIRFPSIFIQSSKFYDKLTTKQLQFNKISMIDSFRAIQFCKPSVSLVIQLVCLKHKIEIQNSLKMLIISKLKDFQLNLIKNQRGFLIQNNVEFILEDLVEQIDLVNQLDEKIIQKYFYLLNQQIKIQQLFLFDHNLNQNIKRNSRRSLRKKKIYKTDLQNYPQLIEIFNSIKKSPKLIQYYKQFHHHLQKQQSTIVLYGQCFSGKTTFYQKYFESIDRHLNSQKSLLEIKSYKKIEISLQIEKFSEQLEKNHFNYLAEAIKNHQQPHVKSVIIIKDLSKDNINKLQQIVLEKKIFSKYHLPILLDKLSFLIQSRSLSQLSPSLICSCKKIFFTQKTVDWTQLLLSKGSKLTKDFIQYQKSIQNYYKITQKDQINQNIDKENLSEQNTNLDTMNYLQIFNVIFTQFFHEIQLNKYLIIKTTQKYLIASSLLLFQSILSHYSKNIFQIYTNQQNRINRVILIQKLFLYSFYWTCYWILQKGLLKKFDSIIKNILSQNNLSCKDVKFMHTIIFKQKTYQMVHIKIFQQSVMKNISRINKDETLLNSSKKASQSNYIQSYETKLYKHFIKILSSTGTNLVIFGKQKIGKSSLIKDYLINQQNKYLILDLVHPSKGYEHLVKEILRVKNQCCDSILDMQSRKNQQYQQQSPPKQKVKAKQRKLGSSKKLVLSNKKLQEMKSIKSINQQSKSKKQLKLQQKRINFKSPKFTFFNKQTHHTYIFVQDISMTIKQYDFILQFLRQQNKLPCLNSIVSLKPEQIQQKNYLKLTQHSIIRQILTIQAQNQIIQKYQHYYSINIAFQNQFYWEEVVGFFYDTLIKSKFYQTEEIYFLTKNKNIIMKIFMKFYMNLQNFHINQFNNQNNMIYINKVHSRLSSFDIEDMISFLNTLKYQDFKDRKQFIQKINNTIRIKMSYKINNQIDFNRFGLLKDQFLLALSQSWGIKYQDTINLSKKPNQSYNNNQHQHQKQTKNIFQSTLKGQNNEYQGDSIKTTKHKGNRYSSNQQQDILMKKVEYQNKHKNFKLNKNIIKSLKKINQCLQVKNNSMLIVNRTIIYQGQSFLQFAFEWFDYSQVIKILNQSQLYQFFSMNNQYRNSIEKNKIFTNNQKKSKYNLNKQKKSRIIYIPFIDYNNWKKIIETFYFLVFQERILQNKIKNKQQLKIVIEYYQNDQKSIKILNLNKSKLLTNSIILHLNISNQRQMNLQNIAKNFIKNQKFNGDYQKSIELSKIIISIYPSLQKFISSNLSQNYNQIKKYLLSQQNFDRFINSFIDIYYYSEVEYKTMINLMDSSLGDIHGVIQEYEYKKSSLRQLKKQLYDTKIKCQVLKERKNVLENQIQNFQNSSNYQNKKHYSKEIQNKKMQIKFINDKKLQLKNKSIYYSNFLVRQKYSKLHRQNTCSQIHTKLTNKYFK